MGRSKRDSSLREPKSSQEANAKKRRRLAPLGMTGVLQLRVRVSLGVAEEGADGGCDLAEMGRTVLRPHMIVAKWREL
jgi:hypothetical protein